MNAIAQPSIGAGYLNSNEVWKSGSSSSESNPMSGFYAGLSYTLPIASGLNFTPGVYYALAAKGDATSAGPFSFSGKQQDHYINVPMMFSFGLDLSSDFRFFVYAGPTASMGLLSKVTNSGSVGNYGGSNSYDRYEENSHLQRFDVLLGGGVGLELMQKVRFNVGYDCGLINRYKSDNYTVHRNQLTAGVAFLF
ncbi:MAG: PorT family protein [Bacteroidales bacterium]|nr:PorT family protein [Bacteroidales bacterium]